MHYPNLTFHGVEAIRLGLNTPVSMDGNPEIAPSGVLQVYGQVGSYRFVRRIGTDKRACNYRHSFTWRNVGFSLKM